MSAAAILSCRVAGAGLWLVAVTGNAHAHAFAQRYDLPLPLPYWLAGAGLAVALSFVAAAVLVGPGRERLLDGRIRLADTIVGLAATGRWISAGVRVLSVCLLALLLAAGFLGPRGEATDNILPVAVWVVWWVGLTFVCAFLGDVWRPINPFRILAEWGASLAGRLGLRSPQPRWRLPEHIGVWPAVVVFLGFAWAELVWPENAVPFKLAGAVLAYTAITLLAMAALGIEAWLDRGEAFSLFFRLVARCAPFDWARGTLQPPFAGLVEARPATASETAFVVLVLATVSFDGIKETPAWGDLTAAAMGGLYRLGILSVIGNTGAATLLKTVGLLCAPLLLMSGWWLACRLSAAGVGDRAGGRPATGAIAQQFVLSLVPIALGYHLAHYLSYLLIQGQAIIPLASDPLGRGWNLLGTRGFEPDIAIIDAGFVWFAAVISIVLGHAAAVLVSHVVALRYFQDRRLAVRSQYPIVGLMIAYTMLSLWILAQPIVGN